MRLRKQNSSRFLSRKSLAKCSSSFSVHPKLHALFMLEPPPWLYLLICCTVLINIYCIHSMNDKVHGQKWIKPHYYAQRNIPISNTMAVNQCVGLLHRSCLLVCLFWPSMSWNIYQRVFIQRNRIEYIFTVIVTSTKKFKFQSVHYTYNQ